MSCCLAGADDATDVVVWHDGYDEQDLSVIHAQALNSLFTIVEPVVENFELASILESLRRGREAGAMLREICRRFGLVPFVFHSGILPDTGSYVKSVGICGRSGALAGRSDGASKTPAPWPASPAAAP